MPRPSEGPKCPTPDEIGDMIDLVTRIKVQPGDDNNEEGDSKLFNKQLDRIVEILDWAGEQVNKRRFYSKKFQLKDKERTRLLKERLGEQYDDIIEQAKHRAHHLAVEEVLNDKPEADDVAFSNSANE